MAIGCAAGVAFPGYFDPERRCSECLRAGPGAWFGRSNRVVASDGLLREYPPRSRIRQTPDGQGVVDTRGDTTAVHDGRMGFELDRGLAGRLSGALWGHLIGDAVGVPYEFGPPVPAASVVFGKSGMYGRPPGTWSDDGAMMLALLDSLLTVGFDPVDQGMRYLAWSDDGAYTPEGEGRFDIGNATAVALGRIRGGVPAEEAGGDESTLGNGSLMRTLPLALVGHDLAPADLALQASRASAVTHASAIARTTCGLYALIAADLLRGQSDRRAALRDATATLGSLVIDAERTALEQILAWPTRGGRGHVIDAFWSAWDAFEGADSYRDTIARAVAYGQDTDTTA